jgi:CheY-like chemotaxis protein
MDVLANPMETYRLGPKKMSLAIADTIRRAPSNGSSEAAGIDMFALELDPKPPNVPNPLLTPPEEIEFGESLPSSTGSPLAEPHLFLNPASSSNHHVLAVDDNAINLRILTKLIKQLGYCYAAACNGFEAVQLYKAASTSRPFSFIFMDISMPVMNGYVAAQEIRAYELEQNIPPTRIVAFTGLRNVASEQEALASGIDLFLTKPVSLQKLKALLIEENGTLKPTWKV